jgi:hypothetical protein
VAPVPRDFLFALPLVSIGQLVSPIEFSWSQISISPFKVTSFSPAVFCFFITSSSVPGFDLLWCALSRRWFCSQNPVWHVEDGFVLEPPD